MSVSPTGPPEPPDPDAIIIAIIDLEEEEEAAPPAPPAEEEGEEEANGVVPGSARGRRSAIVEPSAVLPLPPWFNRFLHRFEDDFGAMSASLISKPLPGAKGQVGARRV